MDASCYCDYDAPEFFSRAIVTARKSHRCYECGNIIMPRDKYESTCGKWEGSFDTFKTCERCLDIRTWVTNNLPCFCWGYGNMIEDAHESVNEATWRAREETRGLRFGLLRRIVLRDRFYKARKSLELAT